MLTCPTECLKNHTMVQEIWQHHRRCRKREGIEKSVGEEPLQPSPLRCFPGKAKEKVWTTNIVSSLWLTSRWHDKSESSLTGDACGKFTDHTGFQSWIGKFRTEVCCKAKNSKRSLQWIKEIEAAKSLDDLITPKAIEARFP